MQHAKYWVLAVTATILLAEIAAGRHRHIYNRREYIVNGLCFVLGISVRPLLAVVVATLIAILLPHGRGALQNIPFWPAFITIVLLAEFCNYWVHRFAHQLRGRRFFDWLWRVHRTHHTARYVNVLLNFRVNFCWALVSGLTWIASLGFYLGQGAATGAAILVFSFWGIATHSNFRWDDALRRHQRVGPVFWALEHIFISPGIHHTHHGFGRDGKSYQNFGIFLSVFDWMFGTLYIPQGRPARYGIPGDAPHWAEEVFYPLYQSRPLPMGIERIADAPTAER
jgi:sterol desaturase/sphingolipid hydroxylase (fatty acid hydroxylase superfamily)